MGDVHGWLAALERPDMWLVVIAFLTGLAIAYQAREMKRATEAMQRSTKLQEVGLRQWVVIDSWQTELNMLAEERLLVITFHIVNPTGMPLTLNEVKVGVKEYEPFVSSNSHFLVPQGRYIVTFSHPFTEAEQTQRTKSGLSMILTGVIRYTDALQKSQQTQFTGILYCHGGQNNAEFYAQGIMVPEHVVRQSAH